jgi:hypothetical protein
MIGRSARCLKTTGGNPTPAQIDKAVAAIQAAFLQTYGLALYKLATTDPNQLPEKKGQTGNVAP